MRGDASELARRLAARAPELARALLPAGKRHGAEWRVGSIAGEPGESCAVRLFGAKAGLWADFAAGEQGDALDLVAAVLYRGNKVEAMGWARAWLGLGDTASPANRRPEPPVPVTPDAEAAASRQRALATFLQAAPLLPGTPAWCYLAGRGIDLAELRRTPRSLRAHPGLFNGESRSAWPALVAAISDPAGRHVATHRTWLARRQGVWGKAPLDVPKMTLGSYAGGSVRLWRGASGKPLALAPQGETVVIGEGIENCLSIALACPELRVLCAVSLANLSRIVLPPAIAEVILAADNDGDNPAARRGLQRAIDHFHLAGRRVRVAMPELPGQDWNDVLRSDAA